VERPAFLLIEDSEIIVKTLEGVLRRKFSDYDIFRAKGREDGLQLYHQHADQIALILLDLALADGHGTEVLNQIIADDANAKVVIVSGNLPGDRSRPLMEPSGDLAEARAVVRKPFELELLINIIEEILAQ
tara:strand:- start:5 stop:397 length:393 start_codon:yes stop_codon:yes gene_type:complete